MDPKASNNIEPKASHNMDDLTKSVALLETTRPMRRNETFPLFSPEERELLLKRCHPDYRAEAYRPIAVGANRGEPTVHEVADLLEGRSPLYRSDIPLRPDYTTDLLVIGGGGAGCTAALTAVREGVPVLLATKLRVGDSNTVMAEGGMQVAVREDDSPVRHYLDTMKGGHLKNDPQLLKILVEEGPEAAKWLMDQGVLFDREENGDFRLRAGGATSKPRLLTCRDYTGLEIMRVLKDALLNEKAEILEFGPAVELLTAEDGRCTGAVLKNLDNDRYIVVRAKVVLLATGGSGRLHIQGFPTSNHFGATGDGLPLAYRTGAAMRFIDTFQYHPTGSIHPEAMAGLLVTEAIRSAGAQLVNREGRRFVHEMDTRDVVAAAIIRECQEGRGVSTPTGRVGVWLDIPLVDEIQGGGTLEKRFPNMCRLFSRYDIDIRKQPVLVFPTLHYQNGGIRIGTEGESTVQNLFVAGEASGGVHGRNRLMGNSLLEIIVFGRRVGRAAARRACEVQHGELTLAHLDRFYAGLSEAEVVRRPLSPRLIPDYVRK